MPIIPITEDMGTTRISFIVEMQKGKAILEDSLAACEAIIVLPHNPAIPASDIYSTDENLSIRKTWVWVFIVALFIILNLLMHEIRQFEKVTCTMIAFTCQLGKVNYATANISVAASV